MRNFKMGMRYLGLNGIIFFVYLFASIGLLSLSNPIFLWIANGLMIIVYAGLIFATALRDGKKDFTADELEERLLKRNGLPQLTDKTRSYRTSNGFIAGMFTQLIVLGVLWLPNLILNYIDISGWADWLKTVAFVYDLLLRFWFVMYSQFFVTFPDSFPWICLIFSLIFVAICGLGYISGPKDRHKEQIIIARNKQKFEGGTDKGVTDR